jgi:hypothetical protein
MRCQVPKGRALMWRKAPALPSRDSSRDRIAIWYELADLRTEESVLGKPRGLRYIRSDFCRFEVEDLASGVSRRKLKRWCTTVVSLSPRKGPRAPARGSLALWDRVGLTVNLSL